MEETKQLVRESGIDVLGSVVWGTHACLFYRTKEDLINILVPYFKAGLENNEFCMWITSDPLDPAEAKKALKNAMPDFDKYLTKGQIEILPHDHWYLDKGVFDRQRVMKGWMDKLNLALNNGYAGARVSGNTTWLNEEFWGSFIEYEHQLNETIDRLPIIAVCTYCLDGCGTSEIVDVANNHQLAIIEKEGRWKLAKNAERKLSEERAREYQAQLKSLASQLTLAEERERRRITTVLHATIGQSIAISKIELDALRHSVSPRDPGQVLKEVSDSLGKDIDNIRSLTFDLSFPILYELGFETAVAAWLVDRIQEKQGIATEFEDDEQPKPLDDDVRAFLFRDVRELLINVVKHAQAKKVKVSIRKVGNEMHVSVEDDGVGFDPAEVAAKAVKAGGFGLFSIRERLEQLGGHLEIESAPGRGTKATLITPLKQEKVNRKGKK
jgi:signal transduction histidine kinase